jgi:hypothetical protein
LDSFKTAKICTGTEGIIVSLVMNILPYPDLALGERKPAGPDSPIGGTI